MNTTITGTGFLDAAGNSVAAMIAQLMQGLFGPGARNPLPGMWGISPADVVAVVCLVLLTAALTTLANAWIRRRLRAAAAQHDPEAWRVQLWESFGRPVQVLLWIAGARLAVAPVLPILAASGGVHPFRQLVDTLFNLAVFAGMLWAFFKLTHVAEARLKTWSRGTTSKVDDLLVPLLGRSLRVIVPVVGLIFALPVIGLSPESAGILAKASSILIIGAVAYILFQAVGLGEKAVLTRYDIKAADNLQARKVYTQVHVLGKTLYVIIAIFTAASILMLFDEVRRFGTSLLASAGVVGVIAGFAAQRTIANLFAGFQLAMTQPIRLDDVVIVEGEWGRIEEITLTYVVIRIWDERRLIVPLSHFIEKPFQNWTRVSAEILGSVFVWADYSLPLADLRPAVQRIVESCPDWDRRFWNLQVTDTTDRAMQLRVLATAADASKAWNLRCEIREKLLGFLQQQHPASLPKTRALLEANPVLKPA